MTPHEQGRFCSVCSKTVRDFTDASDDEMIRAISDPSEKICGNFRESQLNRDLGYSYVNSLFARFAVGFIVTASGLVPFHAQEHCSSKSDTLKEASLKGKPAPKLIRNDTASTKHLILGGIRRESIDKYRSPLYVINGKPGTETDFKALDPESIRKINVLKGAYATGRYGRKAFNGAIEVTTKQKRK
ncbi:hypothetical protein CHA01nite_36250 [Chryseobacterium hagamense]|uniref:TonB-dependent receptor plug domain-containing protein n=2 Tax=Chryseobacterium hagamense TaxID=395935 RepID=A0A511YRR7_9FLAO|nr:hypothetical protein CHA01nite_36250 [Chryseobacterium hagamense]